MVSSLISMQACYTPYIHFSEKEEAGPSQSEHHSKALQQVSKSHVTVDYF